MPVRPTQILQSRVVLMVIFAAIYYSFPLGSGEYLRGWDAPTHIFFASGYAHDWWSTWEPRWYGGYARISYPPLAHQLVALVSHVTGNLPFAYGLVTWTFLTISPVVIYRFSQCFYDDESSTIAALLSLFLPSIRSMVFVFGQFAGYISVMFLLVSIRSIVNFLRGGNILTGLTAACLLGCSVAAHHGTSLYFLPILLPIIIISQFRRQQVNLKLLFFRLSFITVVIALVSLFVIWPFWGWIANFRPQQSISHLSRENFFQNYYAAQLFLFDLYGPLLLFVPMVIWRNLNNPDQPLLLTGFLIFAVLGLGGTTMLPYLLYGYDWQWLTFERFGVWATLLFCPLAGNFIAKSQGITSWISTVILGLLIMMCLSWLIKPQNTRITPEPVNLTVVYQIFEQYQSCRERYLALGFGYQLPDLSTYTQANTLDGMWHSVRNDPLLRSSGVGSLNDALSWENGQLTLETFLRRIEPNPANCIFVNKASPHSAAYTAIISRNGWRLNSELTNNITFWLPTKGKVSTVNHSQNDSEGAVGYEYLWGSLPLGCLILTTFLAILCRKNVSLSIPIRR